MLLRLLLLLESAQQPRGYIKAHPVKKGAFFFTHMEFALRLATTVCVLVCAEPLIIPPPFGAAGVTTLTLQPWHLPLVAAAQALLPWVCAARTARGVAHWERVSYGAALRSALLFALWAVARPPPGTMWTVATLCAAGGWTGAPLTALSGAVGALWVRGALWGALSRAQAPPALLLGWGFAEAFDALLPRTARADDAAV